jgi:hypothetical protein
VAGRARIPCNLEPVSATDPQTCPRFAHAGVQETVPDEDQANCSGTDSRKIGAAWQIAGNLESLLRLRA